MVWESQQPRGRDAWELARKQHGVISRAQLHQLGYSDRAIEHRLAIRRLHRLFRGVYAVGRPEVSAYGRWFGAILACGDGAVLSHQSAALLWGIVRGPERIIHVSVPATKFVRRPGIVAHRRGSLRARDLRRRYRIPVTAPATTIVDIAVSEPEARLERAINEADQLGVIRLDVLRRELERMPRRPGLGRAKKLIDRHTFLMSRSELERRFRPIARRVGLPPPQTLVIVNGVEVDFYWPELGLVVEADSLTYHCTPAKQANDVVRDHRHFSNEILPLRFTHWHIAKQPEYVEEILRKVVAKLAKRRIAG